MEELHGVGLSISWICPGLAAAAAAHLEEALHSAMEEDLGQEDQRQRESSDPSKYLHQCSNLGHEL